MKEFVNKIEIQGVIGNVFTERINNSTTYTIGVVTSYALKDKNDNCIIENTWFNIKVPEQGLSCMPEQLKKGEWIKAVGRVQLNKHAVPNASIRVAAESLEIIINE